MTALVDTSVWVDYLRGRGSVATRRLRTRLALPSPEIVTTEPIAMELLAGPTAPAVVEQITRLVDGLPTVAVQPVLDYRSAAAIFRATRLHGRQVRNLSDCLIAAIAIRSDTLLIHRDADFEAIAAVTPLRHESWC